MSNYLFGEKLINPLFLVALAHVNPWLNVSSAYMLLQL